MKNYISTRRDLSNWVDSATSGWFERGDDDVEQITNVIAADPDRPDYGSDWTDYLSDLPELTEYLEPTDARNAADHTLD